MQRSSVIGSANHIKEEEKTEIKVKNSQNPKKEIPTTSKNTQKKSVLFQGKQSMTSLKKRESMKNFHKKDSGMELGEYGKHLYAKAHNDLDEFVKENKNQIKFQGNKRFSGKSGEYYLQAQANEEKQNNFLVEDEKSFRELDKSNGEISATSRKTSMPKISGRASLWTVRNPQAEEIIVEENIKKNINILYDKPKNIGSLLRDMAILKEQKIDITQQKIQKETITIMQDLTPIPDINRKKLKDDQIKKGKFEKAERSAVSLRRIEYSMGKRKTVKRVTNVNFSLHIVKIIRLQRWWRSVKFPLYKIILIQSNYRGYYFRKKFYENLRKLNVLYINFLSLEKILNGIYLKKYYKMFKRFYFMKKILLKVIFVQMHLRKMWKNRSNKKKGKLLQNIFYKNVFNSFMKKFRIFFTEKKRILLLENLLRKINVKKNQLKKLTKFDRYRTIVRRLKHYERIFNLAEPLFRKHAIKHKNFCRSFLYSIMYKEKIKLLLQLILESGEINRAKLLKKVFKFWSEKSYLIKKIKEEEISQKKKSIKFLRIITGNHEKKILRRRFLNWLKDTKEFLRQKNKRENLLKNLLAQNQKTKSILLRTFILRFLNLSMKLKYIESENISRFNRGGRILDVLSGKNQKNVLKKRFLFWKKMKEDFHKKISGQRNLVKNCLVQNDKNKNLLKSACLFKWLKISMKIKKIFEDRENEKLKLAKDFFMLYQGKRKNYLKKKFDKWRNYVIYLQRKNDILNLFLKNSVKNLDRNRDNLLRNFINLWGNNVMKLKQNQDENAYNKLKSLKILNSLTWNKQRISLRKKFDQWKISTLKYKEDLLKKKNLLKEFLFNRDKFREIALRTFNFRWWNKSQKLKQDENDQTYKIETGGMLLKKIIEEKESNILKKRFDQWRLNQLTHIRNQNRIRQIMRYLLLSKTKDREVNLKTKCLLWLNNSYLIKGKFEEIKANKRKACKIFNLISLQKQKSSLKRMFDLWKISTNNFLKLKTQRENLLNFLLMKNDKIRAINLHTFNLKWINFALKQKQISQKNSENFSSGINLLIFLTMKNQDNILARKFFTWRKENWRLKSLEEKLNKIFSKYLITIDKRNKQNLLQKKFLLWKTQNLIDKRFLRFLQFGKAIVKFVDIFNIKKNGDLLLDNLDAIKNKKIKEKRENIYWKFIEKCEKYSEGNLLKSKFNLWMQKNKTYKEDNMKLKYLMMIKNKGIKKSYSDLLRKNLRKWASLAKKEKNIRFDKGVKKLENLFLYGIPNKNYCVLNDLNINDVERNKLNRIKNFEEKLKERNVFKEINNNDKIYNNAEFHILYKSKNGEKLNLEKYNFTNVNKSYNHMPSDFNLSFNNSFYGSNYKNNINNSINLDEDDEEFADLVFIPYTKNPQKFLKNLEMQEKSKHEDNKKNKLNNIFQAYFNCLRVLLEKRKKEFILKYSAIISQDKKLNLKRIFSHWRKNAEKIGIKENSKITYSLLMMKLFKNSYRKILKKRFDFWRNKKNQMKNSYNEKLKIFSGKMHQIILKNLVKNYLISTINEKCFDNKLKKFLKNLSNGYKQKLQQAFKLWKIKVLKLEKIGLLRFLGSKIILKRSDYLGKLQLKKYFDVYRKNVKRLKNFEFLLEKIMLNFKKKNYEFLKLQILLRDSLRKKVFKIFNLLSYKNNETQLKRYFTAWLKSTWTNKINLSTKLNIRNRLFNLNKIRNSKDYLLRKHFEIWLKKFNLKEKFRFNFLKRNKAAYKLVNLLRRAKAKNQILTNRKIKYFMLKKIQKIDKNKFFNLLKYFNNWKSVIMKILLKEKAQDIALFVEKKFFSVKNFAYKKLENLFTRTIKNTALSDLRFLKVINSFCKNYNFMNKQKHANLVHYIKRSDTNKLFTEFDKTFLSKNNKGKLSLNKNTQSKNLNNPYNTNSNYNSFNSNNNYNSNNNFESNNNSSEKFSNLISYQGKIIHKSDYFKYKNNLLAGKKFQKSYKQINYLNSSKYKNTPVIWESDLNSKGKLSEYNTAQNKLKLMDKHILVTNNNKIFYNKNCIIGNKNHFIYKRLCHVLQYFTLRKDLILTDMKKKYFFKRWEFTGQKFLENLMKIQKNILRFIYANRAKSQKEKKCLMGFVLRKFLMKKMNHKKLIMSIYFHRFFKGLTFRNNLKHANEMSEFLRKIFKFSENEKLKKIEKLRKLFSKKILKSQIINPLKIWKFCGFLDKVDKIRAWRKMEINLFNKSRSKFIMNKYTAILIDKEKKDLENSKKLLFNSWRNYNRCKKFALKKAFEKFRKNLNLIKSENQRKLRNTLVNSIFSRNQSKINWKIREYFSRWSNKNKNFKALMLINNIKKNAIKEINNHLKEKNVIRKYNLLKKGLLRKENIFFVKFITKGAEIRQKKINIYNKINDILLFKFDKEKFIKKSFALKWKRISRTIALDKTVRSIQRRFIIYLRKIKFQKKFNFLKTFNLITMQKIRLNKTDTLDKIIKNHNELLLKSDIEFICEKFNNYSKAKFLSNFEKKNNKIKAISYIRKLGIAKFLSEISSASSEYYKQFKLQRLLTITFEEKQDAENSFLKQILRGWRIDAVNEINIRKKIAFFEENISTMKSELFEKILSKEVMTIPKSIFHNEVIGDKKHLVSNFNLTKITLTAAKNKALVKNLNEIKNYNSNNSKKHEIVDYAYNSLNSNTEKPNDLKNQLTYERDLFNSIKSYNSNEKEPLKLNFNSNLRKSNGLLSSFNSSNLGDFNTNFTGNKITKIKKQDKIPNKNVKEKHYNKFKPSNLDISAIEKYNIDSQNANEFVEILEPFAEE